MARGSDTGVRQQISLDGADEVIQSFKEIGTSGGQAFGKVEKGSIAAGRGIKQFTREMTGVRRASTGLMKQFSDMGRSLESIGGLLGQTVGGAAGGFLGVATFKAVNSLIGLLDGVAERMTKIQTQAREAGVRPLALQAAGEQATQAGQAAEVGERAFTGFAKAIAEAKAAVPKEDTFGVKVQRGDDIKKTTDAFAGIVQVFEGGKPKLLDFGNALETLNVKVKDIKTPEDIEKAIPGAITRALELAKRFPMEMNRLSQSLFRTDIKTLEEISKNTESVAALAQKLAGTERGLTAGREAQLKQLKTVQGEVDTGYKELGATIANAAMPGQIAWDKFQVSALAGLKAVAAEAGKNFNANTQEQQQALANFATNWTTLTTMIGTQWTVSTKPIADWWTISLPGWMTSTQQAFANFWPQLSADMQTSMATWEKNLPSFDDWIARTKAAFASLWQSITDAAAAAGQAISSALKNFPGDPSIPAMPTGDGGGDFSGGGDFAAGGMVRGAGSATSDSIMARLSNGEFVMRASAVRHWGAGLLASMNAAAGGLSLPLVPKNPRRFADGGLVTAGGGGRPVHLHLGNKSFALSGNASVVESLVTEAHRHKIRSAGVKPSWYGGTPGR